MRLHRNGRFRAWLGGRFGQGEELGDRIYRRLFHATGAAVLVYYLVPARTVGGVPKLGLLLGAFGALLVLEALRHRAGLELPSLREYERHRLASFVYYGAALVGAVVLLPVGIATAVVLGTAWVDPLLGELRASPRWARAHPYVPFSAWAGLAVFGLAVVGGWPISFAAPLALAGAAVALLAERPKLAWMDDDLAMTAAPAALLYVVGVLALGLPG